MRARERLRIEKLQKAVKAEKSRLSRASKRDRSRLKPRDESEAFRKILRAREGLKTLQAKLAVAMLAPTRAALRDVVKRPERYKAPPKIRAKLERQERTTIAGIIRRREITLKGSEGRAEKLLFEAFKRGESLKDSFKRIARLTGLSPHKVYTIGKYMTKNEPSEAPEGDDIEDLDSPDDFNDF